MNKLRSILCKVHEIITNMKNHPFYKRSFIISIGLLIIISLFIIAGIDIQPTYVNGTEKSQTLYLLSAIVQSLAAIVALIFTISLVLAQISSRYSVHVLKGFFDKYTYGYIILFIATILITFWQLAETNTYFVKICLILSSACIIFLFPFFLHISEKIDIEFQLDELGKQALKKLSINKTKIPSEINTIENVIFSSFASRDYDTFEKAIELMCEIAYKFEVCIKGEGTEPKITTGTRPYYVPIYEDIMTRLYEVSIMCIKDIRAPFIIAEQYQISDLIKKHLKADETFKITVNTVLSIASMAYELFESSKIEQKRKVIDYVFSNLELEGVTLRYSLRKPFDLMALLHSFQMAGAIEYTSNS